MKTELNGIVVRMTGHRCLDIEQRRKMIGFEGGGNRTILAFHVLYKTAHPVALPISPEI